MIREVDLRGSEKKTWVLHKLNGKLVPQPSWGFAFYKEAHYFQYFTVRTVDGKHSFSSSHSETQDLPKCSVTWHITGDTLFIADERNGRVPYILIRKLTDKELVYQQFISGNRVNPWFSTAIAVPDTVASFTLNCPPRYRFEATHEPIKMID